MSDDDRALQPRVPRQPPVPHSLEVSGEIDVSEFNADEFGDQPTPAPIVVDEHNRQISRSRRPSPNPEESRDRKTIQELVEELWPARKALSIAFEQQERIVALEQQIEGLQTMGPSAIAAAGLAGLRNELVGSDGKGGIVGALSVRLDRDLKDHRDLVKETDERATKADVFVRKVIRWAVGMIAGSIIGAVMLIYTAGARSESGKAESRIEREELTHKIDSLERSLTDLRGQVKLLLETRIRP